MAGPYLLNRRNRAPASPQAQNTILGFLDINFGVLGIFLIVFTIRLVVVSQPAGYSPDILLVALEQNTTQGKVGSFDVYRAESAEPERFTGKSGEIQAYLEDMIQSMTDTGLSNVRVMILVPALGYRSEKRISAALGRIERNYGAGYRPFVSALRPVLGPEHIDELVAAWREGEL